MFSVANWGIIFVWFKAKFKNDDKKQPYKTDVRKYIFPFLYDSCCTKEKIPKILLL